MQCLRKCAFAAPKSSTFGQSDTTDDSHPPSYVIPSKATWISKDKDL